jgi:DNA-binding CsgD family transcriptional regulator
MTGWSTNDRGAEWPLVTPHVRRASLAAGLINGSRERATGLAEVLDTLPSAVFLLTADGCIVHANMRAAELLAKADPLISAGGRLGAVQPEITAELGAALASARSPAASQQVVLPLRSRAGRLYAAHLLPLSETAAGSMPGVAVLFVRPAVPGRVAVPEALARAYSLTPTELRVLLAVVDSGGTAEIADALGVSGTTVKFHLQHLFAKTDTHRQVDLVKRVVGFTSPGIG